MIEEQSTGDLWENGRAPLVKPTDPISEIRPAPASGLEPDPAAALSRPVRPARASRSSPVESHEPARVGFFEGEDGRLRPGVRAGRPWRRFGPIEESRATVEVMRSMREELGRAPRVVEGGWVVYVSPRGSVRRVLAADVATVQEGVGRILPVTVEHGGQVYRLVKLGVFAWISLGVRAATQARDVGRIDGKAWRDAMFAYARLRVKLEEAGAFSAADLDWAEVNDGCSVVRQYAVVDAPALTGRKSDAGV